MRLAQLFRQLNPLYKRLKKSKMGINKLFGTDGIRGQANVWPMTPEVISKVAKAAASSFMAKAPANLIHGDHRYTVVIGKDTRLSGYMVESSLMAGFVAMGLDVILLGPLPTPAVAMLTRSLRANLGVMISASHNHYLDNGIKFFGPDGSKLSDIDEGEIEKLCAAENFSLAPAAFIGKAKRLDDAAGRYIEFAKATFPRGLRLDGLKIVVDCAHGAAYKVAPKILWELGADVIAIGANPDGSNINENCGATSPKSLQESVISHRADLGIALDGDADRLIMVDEAGALLDGDQLMATIATLWRESNLLRGQGIVATHMSNLGLERYLETKNLHLFRAAVGDRYVIEEMRKNGCNIGGEQSGHIILSEYCTTGDGLIAALQILSILVQSNKRMSDIGHTFEAVPQILQSISTKNFIDLDQDRIQKVIQDASEKLESNGRLLIRKSGTEPVIRIMAQGDDQALLKTIVQDIVETIQMVDSKAA